jgi:hypothetical protein
MSKEDDDLMIYLAAGLDPATAIVLASSDEEDSLPTGSNHENNNAPPQRQGCGCLTWFFAFLLFWGILAFFSR